MVIGAHVNIWQLVGLKQMSPKKKKKKKKRLL